MLHAMQAAFRALEISLLVLLHGGALVVRWSWLRLRGGGAEARQSLLARALVTAFSNLGATFIKIAQYLSTRPDIVPGSLARALGRLQDRVEPFPYEQVWLELAQETGRPPEDIFRDLDPYPVASASVAQVHRGRLPDGREVAVKVLRPGLERQVRLDLKLMTFWARVVGWLPPLRLLALPRIVAQFGEALTRQLDLRIEARNNHRFARNFSRRPDVWVPSLVEDLCSRRVLCMEFIHGEKLLSGAPMDPDSAEALARTGYRMLLEMVFVHGFVHADLHPGNLMVCGQRLVMLDLGLVSVIEPAQRGHLMALMGAWAAGNPDQVCRSVLALLDHEDLPRERGEALRARVAGLMERYRSLRLANNSLGEVLLELLRVLREHRLALQPALTMVFVAMGIVEGVGRQLAPRLDLAQEAQTFFRELTFGGEISVRPD